MDIGFLRMMPNITLVSPANGIELKAALKFAAESDASVAIRYPKDYVEDELCREAFSLPFEAGKSVVLRQGTAKLAVVAYGSMSIEALKAAEILKAENVDITVVNARFARPIDEKIISMLGEGFNIITVEDHSAACGFGSAVLEAASAAGADSLDKLGADSSKITVLGIGDEFVAVDSRAGQLDACGISAQKIVETVRKILKVENLKLKV
jgi:deoxyxylulose-5-phosphate synthase